MTFDFKDKVVLITGAAAGLGYACAEAFAAAGAKLVITDISQEALDQAVEKLQQDGTEVLGLLNDASDARWQRWQRYYHFLWCWCAGFT